MDDLFDYELEAVFFGDNGTLNRTADRVKLGVATRAPPATGRSSSTLTCFYTLMKIDRHRVHLSTHVHAKFERRRSATVGRSIYDNSLVHKPCALGYVKIPELGKGRPRAHRSIECAPNCVFVAWDTQFVNDQESETFIGSLVHVIENSVNFFELGFEPFKERV